ncbi:MAG: YafY family transcriptional regulator [Anaerolineae bacterium]|nr:YafY family transcriptional regulator [Anaerolineae bacterium]
MRADRLLGMLLILGARERTTARELAAELAVSERTVYRDVEALSLAGVPVYCQTGPGGGIFLDEGYRVPLNWFSSAEVQAIALARGGAPLGELGLARAAEGLLFKLLAVLPQQQQERVRQAQQRFHVDPRNWFQPPESTPYWAVLQQAVWEDRCVRLCYQPVVGEHHLTEVEAYGLVAKANIWYLVGRKPGRDWRSYRLGRVAGAEIVGGPFVREPGFDLATYWQASIRAFEAESLVLNPPYDVRLQVHQQAFWFFPGYMEGLYRTLSEPDAAGWRELEVRFQSLEHARTQVLGLGTQVRVLEPLELHTAILEHARAVLHQAEAEAVAHG